MSVPLTDDLTWINECFEIDSRHLHMSAYLLDHGHSTFLIDTGTFYHREDIREQIDALVGDGTIDVLLLSNPDYTHSGNISLFLDDPRIDVVCFVGYPELQGYSDVITASAGESVTFNGVEFDFLDPIVSDLGGCAWIYDTTTQNLFTSDGFGHYHRPPACTLTYADLEAGIAIEDITAFQRDTLRWLKYVDPEKIEAAVTTLFDNYEPQYLLPVHGHPIQQAHVQAYVDQFITSIYDICAD